MEHRGARSSSQPVAPSAGLDATEGKPPSRKRSRLVKGIAVSTLVSLFLVGVVELALQRTEALRPWPRYAPGEREDVLSETTFLTPDPTVGWSMRPSFEYGHATSEFDVTYRSNAAGFRSNRAAEDAAPGRRVFLTGDSFTFGIGVELEQTYGGRLESGTLGFTVENAAMPGFAVDQMWLQVTERGFARDPDLIVVGICDADLARSQTAFSISNGLNKPAFQTEDGELIPMRADRFNALTRFLDERSRVWMGLRQSLRWLNYDRPLSEWWHLNEAILDALQRDCAAQGIPLLFVYVPTPEWRPFPTLARYMEASGAHYVDLTLGLSTDEAEAIFYPVDRHFNADGHAHAAAQIEAHIRELLPQLVR